MRIDTSELSTVEMIESTDEAINEFHKQGWGADTLKMTQEQLQEFINGKTIAINDGEYTHTVTLEITEGENENEHD